jgi:plasmid stabilization system protein ParE
MVRTLQKAIAEVASLPDADQEEIGRKLLTHVEKLRRLRADIDLGLRSLDEVGASPSISNSSLRKLTATMAARRRSILWSPEAATDLADIWNFYREVAGLQAAESRVRAIGYACMTLNEHPLVGRARDEGQTRSSIPAR